MTNERETNSEEIYFNENQNLPKQITTKMKNKKSFVSRRKWKQAKRTIVKWYLKIINKCEKKRKSSL